MYKLKADCEFDASDLDAAFMTIAEHFMALAGVGRVVIDGESFEPQEWSLAGGEISLKQIE